MCHPDHGTRCLYMPCDADAPKTVVSDRWRDILVHAKEVSRVVFVFDHHQTLVIIPAGGSDALLALIHQKVDVGPTCGIEM